MQNELSALEAYRPRHMAGAVIFALVMLFNPNVNLIDILPDFIGYFILYSAFGFAADAAPHFAEARGAFLKLAFINLAKLPSLLIIALVRQSNTLDNDVVALFALCFLVIELIFLIPAIKNIFEALFYLGERSDAESLIRNDSVISTDSLRSLTFVFLVLKTALATLPEFLQLSRNVDSGSGTSFVTGSRYYPWAVLASFVLCAVVGIIWLCRAVKYVKSVKSEGKFFDALVLVAGNKAPAEFERSRVLKSIRITSVIIILALLFSFDIIFDNYKGINLLPPFVFSILLFIASMRMTAHTTVSTATKRALIISGAASMLISTVNYFMTVAFIEEHGYSALLDAKNIDAQKAYQLIEYVSIAETAAAIALVICFIAVMNSYTDNHIGIPKTSESYRPSDKRYNNEVRARTVAFGVAMIALRILKLVSVFSNGDMQLIFSNPSDVTMPTIEASSMPWLPTVITLANVVLVIYAVYYVNYLKAEEALTERAHPSALSPFRTANEAAQYDIRTSDDNTSQKNI